MNYSVGSMLFLYAQTPKSCGNHMIHSFTVAFIRSLVWLFVHWCGHSFIGVFIRSFICSFIHCRCKQGLWHSIFI